MLAFAANSLLSRLALQHASIDPASFGTLRLGSGALVLAAIVRLRSGTHRAARPDWLAATMLFAYVACFSFAYLTLAAGTGALILFGMVQLTMFGVGLRAHAPAHGELAALVLAGLDHDQRARAAATADEPADERAGHVAAADKGDRGVLHALSVISGMCAAGVRARH